MVSGSISSVSIQTSSGKKDLGKKKKKTNRSAKLKQCKREARRDQWLSQVKNKGYKAELNAGECYFAKEGSELPSNNGVHSRESDLGSPSNSSSSYSSISGPRSSSCDSLGCYSRSVSDGERSDGCLDDWEAVADALAANEKLNNFRRGEDPKDHHEVDTSPKLPCEEIRCIPIYSRAWRPDDAFRPPSLPNLGKKLGFTMNTDNFMGLQGDISPLSCPICYEELDHTDSCFLPCSCGFRLCLFCHKRILEEDGRCPGCRNPYLDKGDGGTLTVRLDRSASMVNVS